MTTSQKSNHTPIAGYFVGVGFLITAVALAVQSPTADIPIIEKPEVRAEQIMPGQRRVALNDPPVINTGQFDQRCNDCHTLFKTNRDPESELRQHTHVKLSHGNNDACLNCHDNDNRERLTLRGGKTVGYDQVEQLCAQCHGPVYRDWQLGTHGKTVGYWDTNLGESIKLKCSQCHDPHRPAYDPITPLPGPNTFRMGDQHTEHEMINERNPLTRWRLLDHANSHDSDHGGDH